MLFSERHGYKKPKIEVQTKNMDVELRIKLWNVVDTVYWSRIKTSSLRNDDSGINLLIRRLWHGFYKRPLDSIDDYWRGTLEEIRKAFFAVEWHRVYDFLEFLPQSYEDQHHEGVNEGFRDLCNVVLTEEVSGYRFVGKEIVDITSREEMDSLAQTLSSPITAVREHMKRALELYSDKKNPDYRNSIKESICAVEAMCRIISKNEKATLSDALKVIEKTAKVHPALKEAFLKIYGYSSDSDGIRHSLVEESSAGPEDARYFLVSCSAFVNYLMVKASDQKLV